VSPTNSFTATNNYLSSFGAENSPLNNLLPYYDLFRAINSKPHLFGLHIINTSIVEIPDNAFRPLFFIHYNVTQVQILDHKLKRISNNAFQYWASLINLYLINNTLNHIPEKVLNFRK
jgi:hypothetical protein